MRAAIAFARLKSNAKARKWDIWRIFLVDAVVGGGIHWLAAAFWFKERAAQR